MNWVEIKALHKLYSEKEVKLNKTINNSPVFKTHEQAGEIIKERKTYVAKDDFIRVYKAKYLNDFNKYNEFLEAKELLKPQLKFSKKAIELLISFDEGLKNGKFTKLRADLIKAQESVKGFSLMFFKNEKYLDKHPSLVNAIKKILDIYKNQ